MRDLMRRSLVLFLVVVVAGCASDRHVAHVNRQLHGGRTALAELGRQNQWLDVNAGRIQCPLHEAKPPRRHKIADVTPHGSTASLFPLHYLIGIPVFLLGIVVQGWLLVRRCKCPPGAAAALPSESAEYWNNVR